MNKKKESKVVPNVRFKGFTDDWKQRKVREVTDRYDNLRIPVAANLRVSGTTPYYGANGIQDYVDGYTHDGEFILVAEDGANDLKNYPVRCVKGRIWVNNHAHVLQGKYDSADNKFLACAISQADIESLLVGGGRAKLNAENLMDMNLLLPNKAEQIRIGKYFAQLDHLITLHQRKIDKLKNLKKSMLEKMFPKKGTVSPEIRFNGFTNAWKQRKLGELYQRNTERNENLIGYDKTISVATMSYKDDGNGASESSLSTYKVLRVGDIAFEGHTNKQFRFGRFVVNDIGTGIMSPRFSALRPLNEMPVNFWKQYIHSESVIKGILVKSTKAGTMMNELVIPEFLNQTIMIPSENEQAVIGQYFASLDNLITLHQRKLDMLKKLKSACLSVMFI